MNLSSQLENVIAETCLPVDQCNVCTRRGLPILPLRHAVVPRSSEDSAALSHTRMGLRTLRAGYLYVLLDQRVWQAYQVTPDGYLRQFNPYAPPAANESLLSEACTSGGHDAPASFLNIDTHEYTQAWLAFASDPWPRSVLDAYKSGRHQERFRKLDLLAARDNPEGIEDALVMTADHPRVNQQVQEYQRQQPVGPLDSVHGFHSRMTRVKTLKNFLRDTIEQQALKQGVLALVLDDTVGLVQQYNHLRTVWIEARQRYIDEPMTAYKRQTSDLLLAIRDMHTLWAEQQTASFEPMTGDGPPTFVSPEVERQRLVQQRIREYNASLEQRYSETDRASFESSYQQQLADYQRHIDGCARLYAQLCASASFRRIEQHDYDGTHFPSALAYSQTMALCLRGGISEAPPVTDENAPAPDNGPTAMLWQHWLNDPQSPIYRALLLREKSLLAGLLPSFSVTGDLDWGDSEKLYSAVTKALSSDEAIRYIQPHLQEAMAHLLGALNAASVRLQPVLGPGIARAVSRLNSATQLLHNGIHLTELKVRMKLSEYYALQCERLRTLQSQAYEAFGRSEKGIMDAMGEVDYQAQKVHHKVVPLIRTGLLSLAVLDPKVANQMISVTVWVEGDADTLRHDLMREAASNADRAGVSAHALLQDITVGVGSLDSRARMALQGLKVPARQAADWVRTGFTGLRGSAGSGQLLLALGGFYLLNDSMKKNFQEVERTLGSKAPEARLALYGSMLGVLGGGVEIVGVALLTGAGRVQQMSSLSA
ncbi:MAG: T6SS effector BTH_I2691 family protein, partial [Pseudomonas sp.]|uniref:T6SS effector BTH_I2691 family protein n=1 Tax=Pseudomonas sp. TaxID=306 RepID=UPI003D6E9708